MANEPTLNLIMNDVLVTLSGYLNPVPMSLPTSTVSVVSATKKNPSIGSRIGFDTRAGHPTVAIKGGHLDASVQFQVWDSNADDIEIEMNDLHNRLMADRDILRSQGFLIFKAEQTATSEYVADLSIWRKTALFKFLYEYQYQDNDDALGIIAQIPINNDLEVKDSLDRELSTVTDAMRRWDDEEADPLTVTANSTSHATVRGINVFEHRPAAWPGDAVTIERTNLDSIVPPTIYPTLNDFIDAVSDISSPDENASVSFASIEDFLNVLTADGATFELGDPLVDYQAYQILFANPIHLLKKNDVFRISYQNPTLIADAVVYLRANVS